MTTPRIVEVDPLAPPPPRIIENGYVPRVTTPRPKGVHTKHLTELERFRVRTLYYDAKLSRGRIRQITGYSVSQIKTAVRASSAAVSRRAGRPKSSKSKKRSRSSNAKPSTPDASDENAELIDQARDYFAREGSIEDDDDNDGDEGDSDDEEDDIHHESAGAPASSRQPVKEGIPPAAARSRRATFNDLPPEVRVHIWRCALSVSPTQAAPSRSWALAVLPRAPWLELGMSPPPHVRLENPPWSHYVDARHVPATVLARVNREARRTVLERCTPVPVSRTVRESSAGIPLFVWVDRYSDSIYFFGEKFRQELFEMAGTCAWPQLYR